MFVTSAIPEAQILVLLVAYSQISWYANVLALLSKAQDWAAINRIRRRVTDTRFAKTWSRTSPSPTTRAQFTSAIHDHYAHNKDVSADT